MVELKGELLEYGGHLDLKSPDSLRPIEREVEKKVAYMISKSWEGSRRLKADLPGFADEIHRHYPKKWRQLSDHWDNELAALDLDVQVKAKMKRPGLLNKSFEQLLPH
ncbi:Spore germination protein A3 precursor [compost metagenome]